jgi:hypothetical protein
LSRAGIFGQSVGAAVVHSEPWGSRGRRAMMKLTMAVLVVACGCNFI